jgi:hypothetical protein
MHHKPEPSSVGRTSDRNVRGDGARLSDRSVGRRADHLLERQLRLSRSLLAFTVLGPS